MEPPPREEAPPKTAKVARVDRVAPVMARLSKLTGKTKGGGLTDEERTQLVEAIDAAIGEIGEPIDKYDLKQRSDLLSIRKTLAPETPSPQQ